MIRVLAILGLLCLHLPAQETGPTGVSFSETTYNFGTVKQGSRVVHGFAVKNSTATPLTIKNVQFSIPGMNARFRPVVAPGSEGTITVEWDTSDLSGEMDGQANVLLGESPEQQTLLLKAVVQPPLEILPYPAIFLSAFHGEDNECQLKIVSHEDAPISISLSGTESKHFTASLQTIQTGKVYHLVARIPSAALPGRYDEELHLSTDNAKLAALTIPVHVFVKPDLYANPETIDFGTVSAEEMRNNPTARQLLTQTFLVKKRSGEFEIKQVESDLEALKVTKDPPHGKSSTYRIDVALNPDKMRLGNIIGTVEITTNDKSFPLIKVPVTVSVF
jgi:Protein of unknown function (DUF1573)